MTTNNVQAGEISCQYIVDKLGGKGDVIIENGPQVSAVIVLLILNWVQGRRGTL